MVVHVAVLVLRKLRQEDLKSKTTTQQQKAGALVGEPKAPESGPERNKY